MRIDVTKMFDGLKTRFSELKKTNAEINAQDIAKSLFAYSDRETINNLTSIFTQAAMADGKNDLSEAEFEQAINSNEFKQTFEKHTEKMNETLRKAKDPSVPNGPHENTGTPRDHVVAEKGEWFANEIWDPMKKLADEALKYMQENNGTLEKFTFAGFPHGVRLINLAPSISYLDDSNDTFSIIDGRPDVTRHADSAQALVVFEFQGETYKVFSDGVAENLEPWGNPSYNESDIEAWGAPVEDTTSAITGEPHTNEPDETVPKEKS